MLDLDDGISEGAGGPWVAFTTQGTRDGACPPMTFYIKQDGVKHDFTAQMKEGVTVDLSTWKRGWQRDGAGSMPEKIWGGEQPSGDGWTPLFQLRLYTKSGNGATWEGASWGVYKHGVKPWVAEAGKAMAANPGKSPVLIFNGAELEGKGARLDLAIKEWGDLPEGADMSTTMPPPPSTTGEMIGDTLEF